MAATHKKLVVALGGNAISAPGTSGTIEDQFAQVAQTAESLCDAIDCGYELVITHGNGPQVGNILRRVEIASTKLYTIPLEVCVADTQAGMGYMIAQCLSNALTRRGRSRSVTTVVTTVLIDRDDPAFQQPTKAIGPELTPAQAELHRAKDGWVIREEGSGKFRRIVPSPRPREIVELPAIQRLVDCGEIVVCCGGGGIPVYTDADGAVHGAAAVVDKDRTTGMLAQQLDVPTLAILTAVDYACLDFGKPTETRLERITVGEAESCLLDGHFGVGSMRPKIEAGIDFVRNSSHADAAAVIAHVDRLADALDGACGTRIVKA